MLLAVCVPIRFLSVAMGSVLLTEDHMRFRVYAMGPAAAVVIGMNLLLIPKFSALGAGGDGVGECVLLLVTYYCVQRFVKPPPDMRPIAGWLSSVRVDVVEPVTYVHSVANQIAKC